MGAISGRGDGYSIGRDMATLDLNEVTKIVTDQAKARAGAAESMQDSLRDPLLESAAVQANRKQPRKPITKTKAPEKTTANETVHRREEPKALDQELNQKAKSFVESFQTMKEASLLGLRRNIEDLGKEPTTDQIKEAVAKSYGKGHEAEALHAFDFLLETTGGSVNGAIEEAKADFQKENQAGIEKGLNIENLAKSVVNGEEGFKGQEGKIHDLNSKFTELVAMEADVFSLNETLLNKISPEEGNKVLSFFMSAGGEKMRNSELGPELAVIWKQLDAMRAYTKGHDQIERNGPQGHYERAVTNHIKNITSAAA